MVPIPQGGRRFDAKASCAAGIGPILTRGMTRAEAMIGAGGWGSMWWAVGVLLLVLWSFGFLSSYTLGGFIHALLLLALAPMLVRAGHARRGTTRTRVLDAPVTRRNAE